MVDAEIDRTGKILRKQVLGGNINGNHKARPESGGGKEFLHKGLLLRRELRVRVEICSFVFSPKGTAKGGGTHDSVAVRISVSQKKIIVAAAKQLCAFIQVHGRSPS